MKRFLLLSLLPLLLSATANDTIIAPKKNGSNVVIKAVTAGGAATDAVTVSSTGTLMVDKITNAAGTGQPVGGVPVGAIMAFAGSACPTGWIAADGTPQATATYPALDSYLATTWGARSGGNFQIPNLNGTGRYLRGGTVVLDPSSSGLNYQAQATKLNGIGAALTSSSVTITGSTGNDTPDHTHGVRGVNAVTGAASYTFSKANTDAGYNYGATTGASNVHTHPAGSLAGTVGTGITFSGDGTETRPITAVVNYCIKY